MDDVSTRPVRMASLMADNVTSTCRALADHLRSEGIEVEWIDADWEEVEERLDAGAIDFAPICGLGYVRRADLGRPLELFPSPVMKGDLYDDEPIYYSHVLVRADSPHHTFDDLRGGRFATNEPGSQSGYNLIRAHLYDLGEPLDYFGVEVISGSHARSLELILSGQVDAGLIDSTVFEHQSEHDPGLFRIVETLGPSAIPPVVVSKELPATIRERIRQILLRLHTHDEGRRILDLGGISRFAEVDQRAYESIWAMNEKAKRVRLAPDVESEGYDLKRRHLVVEQSSSRARPPMSRRVLDDIVRGHGDWLAGVGGRRAFLAGANLAGANLEGLDLSGAVLDGADLTAAHLHGATLAGASLRDVAAEGADLRQVDFHDADLTNADLSRARLGRADGLTTARLCGADLEAARGLTGSEFAGADVTGVILPEEIREFTGLDEVEEVSRAAQHLLFIVILVAAYGLLLVTTTPASVLRDGTASVTLPVIGTELAAGTAFLGVPIALGAVYLFFHLSMRRLWVALAALPAVFPDGRPLDQRAHPWALSGLARRQVPVLRERGVTSGDAIEEVSALVLGWVVVPVVVGAMGVAYFARGDLAGSIGHGVLLAVVLGVSIMSYRFARRALRGELRRSSRREASSDRFSR